MTQPATTSIAPHAATARAGGCFDHQTRLWHNPGVTLQNALAHPQAEAVAQARDMMRVMVTALTNSAAEVEREWAQSGAKQATGVPA